MEICVHVLEDYIDITVVLCSEYTPDFDDILMIQFLEEHDLSECSLGISGILKCVEDLLKRENFSRFFIEHLPDNAIRTTT